MRRATDATLESVKISREQMDATSESVRISREQMDLAKRQLEDSEAQQRAWLQIQSFEVRRNTNYSVNFEEFPEHYSVEISMLVKNVGSTIAKDVVGNGFTMDDETEAFEKRFNITNKFMTKYIGGGRTPSPGNGGRIILPQETITNFVRQGFWKATNSFYIEQWLSYRDVYGHADMVGAGGRYEVTNDIFTLSFNYLQMYQPPPPETNSIKSK